MRIRNLLFAVSAIIIASASHGIAQSPSAAVDPTEYFGALAYGEYVKDGYRYAVPAWSADTTSESEADNKALATCATKATDCKVVARFGNGACGYIASATTTDQKLEYRIGKSPEEIEQTCKNDGVKCGKSTGSCTHLPNNALVKPFRPLTVVK